MKKVYIFILGLFFIAMSVYSQEAGGIKDFDIRVIEDNENWPGYVVIQIRANNPLSVPDANTKIERLQFGIKWNRAIVNGNKLDFDFVCAGQDIYNPYHIQQEDHPLPHNVQGWDFRNFELSTEGVNQFPPYGAWEIGAWNEIAVLKVFRRTPGGQVIPHGFFYIMQEGDPFIVNPPRNGYNPIFKIKKGGQSNQYMMNVPVGGIEDYESTELPVPTATDMNFTWVGGHSGTVNGITYDGYSWNYGPNWENGCGGGPSEHPPTELDDCIIPSGCANYPRYPRPGYYWEDTAVCNSLWLKTALNQSVAQIQWMKEEDFNGDDEIILNVYGDMSIDNASIVSIYKKGLLEVGNQIIYDTFPEYKSDLAINNGFLKIYSKGYVRVLMDTDINGSIGKLIIYSGLEGPGNFKNYGDISYSGNGKASIQTFMENNASVGDYFFHTVGPTVYNQDYHEWGGPTGTGVALRNFDLDILQTFAYQWQEDKGEWLNVYPYSYPIATATGLMLSDTTGDNNSFTQTGEILTGDISVQLHHTVGNPSEYKYLELVSNPYPCAISWESVYNRNNDKVCPIIYMYNATEQEWGDYNALTNTGNNGVTDLIQVGQGFFVKTTSNSLLTFINDDKRFSDAPLRSTNDFNSSLKIAIEGNGMRDEMVIHFMDEATSGYDELYDTEDWGSYYADATQVNSPVIDKQLSVTSLPFQYDQMMNVPVNVKCAKADSYSLTFSNLESFSNVDIWLEDTYAQGDWMMITPENSTYVFFHSPELQSNRFVVHFNASFLPNSIEEVQEELIKIYSSRNNVYIINNSNETVKEIMIINLMGQEIMRTQVPQQNNYKLRLDEPTGYYVVWVRTNEGVYTNKVLIFGN